MKGYILSLFQNFSCLAGRCPATCCSGWNVKVDEEAYQRFVNLTHEDLKRDILENICVKDGQRFFQLTQQGDCAMLDQDGLCRIQRNLEEAALCNTCRKYPRLTNTVDGQTWLSMAASCPVVADYILEGKVAWMEMETGGFLREDQIWDLPVCRDVLAYHHNTIRDSWYLLDEETLGYAKRCFDLYQDLALEILELVVSYPDCAYLPGSFDAYEEDDFAKNSFSQFCQDTSLFWTDFRKQYLFYRIPSRHLEKPTESLYEKTAQVMGELMLLRVIICSRWMQDFPCNQASVCEVLTWVYRFVAHGNHRSKRIHQTFCQWYVKGYACEGDMIEIR